MATSSSALLRAPRLRFSSSSTLSRLSTTSLFSASASSSSQAYASFADQKQRFLSTKAFRSLRWSATTRWSHGVNWRGCGSSVSLRAQARNAAPVLDRNLSTSGTLFLLASECTCMHMYMYMHACMYVCISTCLFTWRFGILSKSKQTRLYYIKVIIRESILIAFWISANKIMFGQIVILF